MKKQYLAIISIIAIGSLFSVGYAASTIITDTSISTTNLTVTGTCTGCGMNIQIVDYTGDGAASKNVTVSFQPKLIHIDRLDVTSFFTIATTNGTAISVSEQSGGTTFSFADVDNGKYTTSNHVDVGTGTLGMNAGGVSYRMTVMK